MRKKKETNALTGDAADGGDWAIREGGKKRRRRKKKTRREEKGRKDLPYLRTQKGGPSQEANRAPPFPMPWNVRPSQTSRPEGT